MNSNALFSFHIHKSRKAKALFSDTFQFLNSAARLLIQTTSIFSLAPMLLAVILSFVITESWPNAERIYYAKETLSKPFFVLSTMSFVVYMASFASLTLIVNQTMILRDARKNEAFDNFSSELKNSFPTAFKTYLFNFSIIVVLFFLINLSVRYLNNLVFQYRVESEDDIVDLLIQWLLQYGAEFVLYPLLMYFGFSALFLSVRDNIGSSDALIKIFNLSQGQWKKIWINCLLVFLTYKLGEAVISYFSNTIMGILLGFTFNKTIFFILSVTVKSMNLGLLVFMQVASVLQLGSISDEKEGSYIKSKIEEL